MRVNYQIPVAVCATIPGRDCAILATVRPGWTMPTRPAPEFLPVVHNTGDGWCTSWQGEDGEEGPLIVGEDGWPFVEDSARAADWEACGWWVV
jgi:hypothetical protein